MSKKNLTSGDNLIPAILRWEAVPAQAEAVIDAIGDSHDLLGQFYRSAFAAMTKRPAAESRALAALALQVYQHKGGLTVQQANRLEINVTNESASQLMHDASSQVPQDDLSQAVAYLGLATLLAPDHSGGYKQVAELLSKAGVACALVVKIDGGTHEELFRFGMPGDPELATVTADLLAKSSSPATATEGTLGPEKWWFFSSGTIRPSIHAALRGNGMQYEIVRQAIGRLIAKI